MYIKKITLKNFLPFKEETIFFKKGISVFSGRNGSGKSSVMTAFSLMLLDSSPGNLKDNIHWGEKKFEISMDFDHLGNSFRIALSSNGKVTDRILMINDTDIYKGNDAKEKLAEFFEPKKCEASMFSFQDRVDLVKLSESERRELCKLIYDFDFSSIIEDIKREIDVNRLDTKEIETRISILENKEYDYQETMSYPFTEEEKNKYEADLILEDTNQKKLIKKITIRNTLQNEINDLKETVKKSKEQLEEKNRQVDEANKRKEALLGDSIERQKETEKKSIDQQIQNLKEPIKVEFDKENYAQKTKQLITQENNLEIAKTNIVLFEKGECPTCGAEFSCQELEKKKEEKDSLEKIVEELSKECSFLKETENNYNKYIEEKNSYDRSMENLINSKNSIDQVYEEKIIHTENTVTSLKKQITYWEKEIENLLENMNGLQEKIKEKESKLSERLPSLAVIEERIADLRNKISDWEKIHEYNKTAEKLNRENKDKEKADKEETRKLNATLEKLIKQTTDLSKGSDFLRKTLPSYGLAKLVKKIQYRLNDFLMKTYGGRYFVKMRETKNGLSMVYGDNERDVRLASGYEKQVFSLATKYAIGAMEGYKFMAMDEVDSNADSDNSLKLYDLIGRCQDMYEQIFIISHKPTIVNLLTNIYKANVYKTNVYDVDNGKISY